MKNLIFNLLIFSLLFGYGCNNQPKTTEAGSNTDTLKASDTTKKNMDMIGAKVGEKEGISIYYLENAIDYPTASIKLTNNPGVPLQPNKGRITFNYEVANYELAKQTPGEDMCNCANSAKGQHIHLILNDNPYTAYYKPKIDTILPEGHYLAVAFLSRSYHVSIKNKTAYSVTQFDIGYPIGKQFDLTKPMLVYSRPKGEYKGAETKNIILDFYLLNNDLDSGGNKVKATINGKEFILAKWVPYVIQGLPIGENTIKLELIDKDGKLIPGPYNSVTRKIKLTPAA
jgi:hypothetical protein